MGFIRPISDRPRVASISLPTPLVAQRDGYNILLLILESAIATAIISAFASMAPGVSLNPANAMPPPASSIASAGPVDKMPPVHPPARWAPSSPFR